MRHRVCIDEKSKNHKIQWQPNRTGGTGTLPSSTHRFTVSALSAHILSSLATFYSFRMCAAYAQCASNIALNHFVYIIIQFTNSYCQLMVVVSLLHSPIINFFVRINAISYANSSMPFSNKFQNVYILSYWNGLLLFRKYLVRTQWKRCRRIDWKMRYFFFFCIKRSRAQIERTRMGMSSMMGGKLFGWWFRQWKDTLNTPDNSVH